MAPPAWMAELSEEWIEPVEEAEQVTPEDEDRGLDFGSLVINDMPLPSPSQASINEGSSAGNDGGAFGSTVFKRVDSNSNNHNNDNDPEEEKSYQVGSILFSPSKKRTNANVDTSSNSLHAPSPGQQLAMAARAFNHDLLHDDGDGEDAQESSMVELAPRSHQKQPSLAAKRTPAKLQSLFVMPTPPSESPKQANTNRSSSGDEAGQDEEEPEVRHTDMTHEGRDGEGAAQREQEDGSFVINQDLQEIPEQSLFEGGSTQSRIVDATAPVDEQASFVEAEQEEERQEEEEETSHAEPSRAAVVALRTETPNGNQSTSPSASMPQLPSTEFSFRVEPLSPPLPLSSYLDSIFATPSQGDDEDEVNGSQVQYLQEQHESLQDSRGIATSTPSTSRHASRLPSPSNSQPPAQEVIIQTPEASNSRNSSTSSPSSRRKQQNIAKPSPALSIFKFHQDTYTRQHLQALVAEIEGLTSPPRNSEPSYAPINMSDSQIGLNTTNVENRPDDHALAASRRGMYRQSGEYGYDQDPSASHTQTFDYSYHTAHVEQDDARATRMESPYRHNMLLQEMDEEEDDENGRIANTRSSKRVRLSASDYQPQRFQHQIYQQQHRISSPLHLSNGSKSTGAIASPIRTRIQNRVMAPRTQSPLRASARRAPFTTSKLQYSRRADMSDVSYRTNSPARPPLRSLPPMTAPVRRTYKASILREENQTPLELPQAHAGVENVSREEDPQEGTAAPVETPPSRWRHTAERPERVQELGKTPAHVVQGRLQEAKALMERIRQRNSQRHPSSASTASTAITAVLVVPGSDRSPLISVTPDSATNTARSYLGSSSAKRKPVTRDGTLSRPANPTPSTAALAHQWHAGRLTSSMAPTPEEEEVSFNAASACAAVQEAQGGESDSLANITASEEERLDSLAPLPEIGMQPLASVVSTRRQLSNSPVVNQVTSMSSANASPAPLHASSFASSSKRAFSPVPVPSNPRHLQAPRHPPSFSSHTSSDRFFTSTSTRYVSGSTAPTSLVASSIGTAKAHFYASEMRHGIVNIPPGEAENLLTEDVLGDMVFDDANKKWVKIDKFLKEREASNQDRGLVSPARIEGPALSPIEELPAPEEESTADDPFRDMTGFESSRSRNDNTGNSSSKEVNRKHNRSGSLVLPLSASQAASQRSEDDRHAEKTSTPPHVAVAPPFISPDLPSIQQASSGQADSRSSSEAPQVQRSVSDSTSENLRNASRRSSGAVSVPPKSVLKRSDGNAFSTPLPSSKLISRITSKQTRSVRFSDGKLPGRGDSLDAQQARVASSALRNEVQHSQLSDADSAIVTASGDEQQAPPSGEDVDRDDDTISLDAYTSTVTKGKESQQNGSRLETSRHLEQDTPTALYHTYTKPRSLRLKPRGPDSLGNSMVSTTSTLAWHRKPLNANATILTECSFGVSYDRLLRVLTDVVPFEPSWKDLEHINLRETGLESVVRLKEFLPNLDEVNLSDNNIAYLTGLPSSLRFLSLANNRLGDLSSFTYLRNLETLDITGNTGITSVRQLACLQHLRTLKANGCGIDSIEGIDRLDGLVTVSLRNNSITQLRLEDTAWTRLETLDASDNNILEVSGIESLPSLRYLNLDYNRLQDFCLSGPSLSLRILKISNNSLDGLDLALMPNVRTVFADCNRITNLSGTHHLCKLENLSLREQRQGSIDFPVKDLRDVRRLYLSYNPIPDAFPSEHFLNLTLLELSGCRLTSLPSDFASVVPNCRVLILDNNFLTTLAPVAGANRLRAISAVANRLDKVRDLLSIWLECTELETLDLRLNPMTLGFYASPNVSVAPPNLNLLPSEENVSLKAYKALDSQHRHTLPNEWLAKRTAYRALVIEAAPALKLLDGLKVGRAQRQRARELVERFAS